MSEDEVDKTEQTLKILTNWRAYLTDEDRATLGEILERIRPQAHEQTKRKINAGLERDITVKSLGKFKPPRKNQT